MITKVEIELARKNGTVKNLYDHFVNIEIRKRYSMSNEFAILRQKETKPDDFAEYDNYVEACKARVKSILELDDSGIT